MHETMNIKFLLPCKLKLYFIDSKLTHFREECLCLKNSWNVCCYTCGIISFVTVDVGLKIAGHFLTLVPFSLLCFVMSSVSIAVTLMMYQ